MLGTNKPHIAFGLAELDAEIIKSLERAKQYADITLVGPAAIEGVQGFTKIIDANPEERLAAMLAHDEVEGIVRGTIDDFKTYEAYTRLTGERETVNPGLMESARGHLFFLNPVSNPEGWEKEERLYIAEHIAQFMQGLGLEPRIAVYTGMRHGTRERRKGIEEGVVGILNKTYDDAEWIVGELTKKGYHAKNWSIDLNPAVEEGYNLHIPVNGMVGNQIFRAMAFSGGKVLVCPRLGLTRCYEDNSRTEKDFEFHIKWLAAWINSRR